MLRALAEEDSLRVFAEVVAVTGTGLPERREVTTSIRHVTVHGVSRRTGLPVGVVVMALKRLTESGLAIEKSDGGGWRTDFLALRRVADVQVTDRSAFVRLGLGLRRVSPRPQLWCSWRFPAESQQ